MDRTDRQTNRQAVENMQQPDNRQIGRQTDRQTDMPCSCIE